MTPTARFPHLVTLLAFYATNSRPLYPNLLVVLKVPSPCLWAPVPETLHDSRLRKA